jgi:hypothetical protein
MLISYCATPINSSIIMRGNLCHYYSVPAIVP